VPFAINGDEAILSLSALISAFFVRIIEGWSDRLENYKKKFSKIPSQFTYH